MLRTQGHRDAKVHRKTRRLEAHSTSARSRRDTRVQALTHARRPVRKAHTAAIAGARTGLPSLSNTGCAGQSPPDTGGPPSHTHTSNSHTPNH